MVIRDLHQGPSATSSLADSQQQSSAVSQPNKHKKHQNYFSNKKHSLKEPTQNTQNTQTNNTPHSQNTNSPSPTPQINTRASAKPWRHKKGRTTNRLNSKQRRELRKIALEGLPSGSPGQPRGLGLCGDQMTQAILPRNSKWGIRSKEKIAERKVKRSYKRREARRGKRTAEGSANQPVENKNANSASAQEPHKRYKLELGKEIHIATLKVRGTNKLGKREEVENWMKTNNISILALQETKSAHSKRENRKDYIWYFSGNGKERCHQGVGIVIRKDLAKHIEDIEPINERLMYITIDGTIQVNLIVAYMPTAIDPIELKDKAYEELQDTYDKLKNKGPTYIVGDFNARLIYPNNSTEEEAIGKFTMHDNTDHLRHKNYTEGMLDNR